MKIPETLATSVVTLRNDYSSLKSLQSGQQIYVKVIEQLPSKHEVLLQVGKTLITAKSTVSTHIGETIKATVIKNANEIILSVKPEKSPADIITTSLKQLLPKQLPVQNIHTSLKSLQTSGLTGTNHALLSAVNSATSHKLETILSEIKKTLPDLNQITTIAGLKKAIQNSGVFFEAGLKETLTVNKNILNQPHLTAKNLSEGNNQALSQRLDSAGTIQTTTQQGNQSAITSLDAKANLIRLIALLKQWPSNQKSAITHSARTNTKPDISQINNSQIRELLTNSEGALAKVTLNQIASTTESTAARQSWQFDLPYFNGQTMESVFIKVEEDDLSDKKQPAKKTWSVSVELSPPKLGQIRSKITLDGSTINSQFWAQNPATGTLIRDHLKTFKAQLLKVNLETNKLQVFSGEGIDFTKPSLQKPLLNEKA